jgi:uncharacterized protein YlxW (UPF0749 family)
MKTSRNIAITLVCIILGIMIAWQYKSINYNQSVLSFQSKRTEELKDELIKLQNSNSELRTRLQELIKENEAYENARAGDDKVTNNLKKQLEEARIFAGLTDVKGRGVIVTLDKNEFISVEDIDILNVVNELRAAGAQAISINEERVVSLTEVRQVGRYVVVNGVKLEAPFIIKAISDPDKLERALTMIGGVIETLENYQLKVSIKKSDNILIPKVRDDGTVIKTDLLTPVK